MRFGSVCSGIEAASVAWHPLGWTAAWLAEIEPFPSAVLAHHYPEVPNHGDMTALPKRILLGEVEAPDLFCGGTPCQAFSVAGLRRSLDDARGNLSLTFCEIADAIDHVRGMRGQQPSIIFWENVPGVLSTKDNAFGCFLAGLAGEDDPLQPPGGKWANAGCVYGPARAVAWRTLDAQYFGVAQRRRRVFVVASARDDFDPAAVLFEFDGVRRDTAPSREARKVAPAGALRSTDGGSDVNHARAGHLLAFGGNRTSGPRDVASAHGGTGRHDFETETFITHSLRGEGFDASEDGTGRGTPLVPVAFPGNLSGTQCAASVDVAPAMGAKNPTAVSYAIQAGALRTNPLSGPDGVGVQADHAYTLEARSEVQAVAFAQNSRNEVRLEGGDGQRCGALSTGGGKPGQGVPMIAFHPTQDPISSSDGTTHALSCGSTGGQASVAVAVALRGREGGATAELGDEVQNCLRASSGGGDKPHVLAPVAHVQIMPTMTAGGPSESSHNQVSGQMRDAYIVPTTNMQVRRLTPRECERLQGFPDGYTAIPWRGKPADECPDGPRYKALGNSWAVPVVAWIGRRIQSAL